MKQISALLLLFFTIATTIPSCSSISGSFRNYHQEIIYPVPRSFWKGSVSRFKFAPPVISHLELLESPGVSLRGPPLYPLFTPNAIDQRPETVGQIEEYKKALAEEAEERKKEIEENEISSTFGKILSPGNYDDTTKSFVDVRGESYDYKYRV